MPNSPQQPRHFTAVDPERLARAVEVALEEMEARTLTEAELVAFRKWMREQERMAWARDVFRSYWVLVMAGAGALASMFYAAAKLVVWLAENVQFKGH